MGVVTSSVAVPAGARGAVSARGAAAVAAAVPGVVGFDLLEKHGGKKKNEKMKKTKIADRRTVTVTATIKIVIIAPIVFESVIYDGRRKTVLRPHPVFPCRVKYPRDLPLRGAVRGVGWPTIS